MKKAYTRPSLLEYGAMGQLTLGSGGAAPDYVIVNGGLVDTNTTCDHLTDPNFVNTGCIIVS